MNPGKQLSIYVASQQTWSLNLLFQDSNFADGWFLGFGGQPSWKVFNGEWLQGKKKSLEKTYPIEDRTLWWWNEQGSSFQLCYKLEEKMVLHTSPHLLHPISLNLLLILIILQQTQTTQRTSNPFTLPMWCFNRRNCDDSGNFASHLLTHCDDSPKQHTHHSTHESLHYASSLHSPSSHSLLPRSWLLLLLLLIQQLPCKILELKIFQKFF
jgi:hypothetical protein